MLKKIEEENFQQEVLDKQGVVLVDFFATWCQPCQMLLKELESMSKKVLYDIVEIDVDNAHELAINYGIEVVPTLIIFQNGNKIKEITGYYTEEALTKLIDDTIATL